VAYAPPNGDAIALEFTSGYTPPAGDAIVLAFGIVGDPPVFPTYGGAKRIAWGRLRRVDSGRRIPWQGMERTESSVRAGFAGTAQHLQKNMRLPWQDTVKADKTPVAMAWDGIAPKGQSARAAWINPGKCQRTVDIPWGKLERVEKRVVAPFIIRLSRLDHHRRLAWGQMARVEKLFVFPWINSLPRKDRLHRVFWGRELYERICMRGYEPPAGDNIILRMDTPISQVGDGANITLIFNKLAYDLRCQQREPGGWRDPYTYVPPVSWPVTPKLEAYYTLNTAMLTRVSDRAPVEIHRMELACDIDSWCWTFSARVPEASLALVDPLAEPVEVEAEINGFKWVVLVESWSESASFGRREYQIRGRSVSAVLADPYALLASGINTLAANARQLAEEQLLYTGWTIDWGIVDWLVGAGALSYSNSSPLKTIQRIVETAGGRVMSHRTAKELLAIPRLHSVPWSWGAATPDLGISDYVVRKLSREYDNSTAFNAVFVSGEAQGVLAKVLRTGTAGDIVAPMVTDALITATEPARERGREIIGRSGKWSKEGLELLLTQSGSLPGLLEAGQLIEMTERGVPWRGQVVGVRVIADRSSGLRVSQDIDVERWYGD
jgi:hypothetical protein